MKVMLSRITLGRTSLATACLGLALFLATRLVPLSQAQDPPPVQAVLHQKCEDLASPCGSACPNLADSECIIDLKGWKWGTCVDPANQAKPCTKNGNNTGCGDEVDCAGDYVKACNLGVYDTCTQQ